MAISSIFHNGSRPPFWIFENSKCYPTVGLTGSKRITVLSFVKLDQTVARHGDLTVFEDEGRSPSGSFF